MVSFQETDCSPPFFWDKPEEYVSRREHDPLAQAMLFYVLAAVLT
jgi:hypothetical protein